MSISNWNLEQPNLERPNVTERHKGLSVLRWIVDIAEIIGSFIAPELVLPQLTIALAGSVARTSISAAKGTLSASEGILDFAFATVPAIAIARRSRASLNRLNELSEQELKNAFPTQYQQAVNRLGRQLSLDDNRAVVSIIEKTVGGATEGTRYVNQSIYNILVKTQKDKIIAKNFREALQAQGTELQAFKNMTGKVMTRAHNFQIMRQANKTIRMIAKETGYGNEIVGQIIRKELRLSRNAMNVNGLFTWFPARPYHLFVQAVHFLDPKLASRKLITIAYRKTTRKLGLGQHGLISLLTRKLMRINVFSWYQRILWTRDRHIVPLMPKMGFTLAYRAIPMDGYGGVYTVILYFNPIRTRTKRFPRGKPPVYLFPMTEIDIKRLEAETGSYYLDVWAASRGGRALGGFNDPITGTLFSNLKYGVMQDTFSLVHHLKKDIVEMRNGEYSYDWYKTNFIETAKRLGPHKIGKFFLGRYGIAIARGFQHKHTKNGREVTTIFDKDINGHVEFNPNRLYTAAHIGSRQYFRQYESTYSRQRRRAARYSRQYLRARKIFDAPRGVEPS